MHYIDGCVIPVPTADKQKYLDHAQLAATVFKEHGALKVTECWGDDVPEGKLTSFPMAVKDEKRYPVDGALCVTRTRDGGQSFEVLRKGLPQQHCYDLIYRHGLAVSGNGNTLMMGSTTGGLWVPEDAGDSWTALSNTLPPVYAVAFG